MTLLEELRKFKADYEAKTNLPFEAATLENLLEYLERQNARD